MDQKTPPQNLMTRSTTNERKTKSYSNQRRKTNLKGKAGQNDVTMANMVNATREF